MEQQINIIEKNLSQFINIKKTKVNSHLEFRIPDNNGGFIKELMIDYYPLQRVRYQYQITQDIINCIKAIVNHDLFDKPVNTSDIDMVKLYDKLTDIEKKAYNIFDENDLPLTTVFTCASEDIIDDIILDYVPSAYSYQEV